MLKQARKKCGAHPNVEIRSADIVYSYANNMVNAIIFVLQIILC